tara:strand:- start:3826 stop:6633 length:2808 start_codon:yes stop_codon:yes gene_type:complete
MYILKILSCLYLAINSSFLFSYTFNLVNSTSNLNPISNPHIIAIMVEFEEDNSPLTSGNGLFLDSLDIDMVSDPSLKRCNQFILDRPPHDADYFSSQIQALSNYYSSVSNENINITSKVILNPNHEKGYYKLSNKMELYSYSDITLSELFKESLEISKNDIESYLESNPAINFNDIIFTVFHAGIGQDFSFPTFDPTVYDIKSAYIEPVMFGNIEYPVINGNSVSSGILLPETQNMIFFSSIEDIFYGESSYCDYQLGMTGTFSFLMGYALGLPPLFNTETGDPGIGIFGLMDYGSNNGRGIIPSLPSPWSRILMNWSDVNNMTAITSSTDFIVFDVDVNEIYQFDVSDNEYFLIENKINELDNGLTIRDIVSDYNGPYEDNVFPDSYSNWLDAIISENDIFNVFEFSEDSVITNVIHYDLGLPESGLLIWHVNEPTSNLNDGINNDPNNKSISIEEADGALDIGFESYALFSNDDPTSGTKWDFWYRGNEAYHYANNIDFKCFNPESYSLIEASYNMQCIDNGGIWLKTEIFDQYSNPNSNLNDNTKSFFSFEILDSTTKVKVSYNSSIPYLNISHDYEKILGTSPTKVFYGLDDMTVFNLDLTNFEFSQSFDEPYSLNSVVLTSDVDQNFSNIYNITTPFGYLISDEESHELIELDSEFWLGTFLNIENNEEILTYNGNQFMIGESDFFSEHIPSDGVSLADIDQDGLHEIIFVDNQGQIVAYNDNGTLVNGFPIGTDYHGVVLIVSEKDTNDIVIICRNLSHIDFVWLNGDLVSLPSLNNQSDLMIISDYLTDGKRYYDLSNQDAFFQIGDNKHWVQRYNRHSHYPIASEPSQSILYPPTDKIITTFYNYPNPIKDGKTKFRFYVNQPTGDIDVKIYNISGHLISSLSKNNIVVNEYNEIEWDANNFLPGLYFAEILSDNVQQKIIKVVVGH